MSHHSDVVLEALKIILLLLTLYKSWRAHARAKEAVSEVKEVKKLVNGQPDKEQIGG